MPGSMSIDDSPVKGPPEQMTDSAMAEKWGLGGTMGDEVRTRSQRRDAEGKVPKDDKVPWRPPGPLSRTASGEGRRKAAAMSHTQSGDMSGSGLDWPNRLGNPSGDQLDKGLDRPKEFGSDHPKPGNYEEVVEILDIVGSTGNNKDISSSNIRTSEIPSNEDEDEVIAHLEKEAADSDSAKEAEDMGWLQAKGKCMRRSDSNKEKESRMGILGPQYFPQWAEGVDNKGMDVSNENDDMDIEESIVAPVLPTIKGKKHIVKKTTAPRKLTDHKEPRKHMFIAPKTTNHALEAVSSKCQGHRP
ncbi:hypothetical protein BDM02DRAFT_3188824 [Thelephora ganbajun]|uniref:Uncharacterized protein n=1 Tax=Thelephora ganbajun TaxID=370292 RepID=A0ACB6ZAS9_THEGA|nr:hypothetical protein BDM02DRAFT_3188824 [Thelephora ganbajun]